MFSFKRSHALIAALSVLAAVIVVREVYPAIVTTSTAKKVQRRFVLRNVQAFFTPIEISPGVPYVVPTKKRFVITDISICNEDATTDGSAVLLVDQNNPTVTLTSNMCVEHGHNVHINYTVGPEVLAGQGITLGNEAGPGTPLFVYISGYEEKG